MERGRSLAVILGAIVMVALLVGGALWLVRGPKDPGPLEREPDAPSIEEPKVVTLSIDEARRMHHEKPWPFGEFKDDITSILKPGRREVFYERYWIEVKHAENMEAHLVTLSMRDTTVQGVVAELRKYFQPYELEVFTGPPHLPDHVRFDVDVQDMDVNSVIAIMHDATKQRMDYEVTPRGLAIGSKRFVQLARLDAKEWEARRRQVHAQVDDSILDVEYRPDFREAHIGSVARDITEKTGIDTIIGRRLWGKAVSITWRADPMPLEDAMESLGEQIDANYHVFKGRLFLLAR